MRRMTTCRAAPVLVVLALAVGIGACGGEGGTASTGPRYLVLPEGTPGLVVGEEDGAYGSAVVRADSATVALVRPSVMPGSFEELTAGRATATLANGLDVFYVCGGRGVSGPPQDDPTGDTVVNVNGPLTILARVEGGYLSVEDTPTDTGACTQPTSVEGPLVDMAASLRWVDEAEFRRLVEAYPGPERTTPPATG
jgi:hypothetical protein